VVALELLHQVMYVEFRHGVCYTEESELLVSGSASATWIVDSESCDVCNSAAETRQHHTSSLAAPQRVSSGRPLALAPTETGQLKS
jgi:hypothetical protein